MSRYHTNPRRRRHFSDSSDDYSSSDGEHDASNHTKRRKQNDKPKKNKEKDKGKSHRHKRHKHKVKELGSVTC
ncbi:unnamed protein product [Camellia sinensis]